MTIAERLQARTGYITLHELAAILGSHPQTLYKACRKGNMPHVRVGSRIKFDPSDVADWLRGRQVA